MSWMTAAVVAIVGAMYSPILPPRAWLLLAVLVIFLILGRFRQYRLYLLPTLAFLAGLVYAAEYGRFRLAQQWPESQAGIDTAAVITILSTPEHRPGPRPQYRFAARLEQGQCFQNQFCPPGSPLLRLNWYGPNPPPLGSQLRAMLRLWPPEGRHSPGAFDYTRWLWSQGYAATGYVRNPDTAEILQRRSGVYSMLGRQRARFIGSVRQVLQGFEQHALMQTLLFADRGDVSREQWRVFARTGTSHVMAISGMHLAIVYAWVAGLGGLLAVMGRGGRAQKIAVPMLGLGLALAYAWLADFGLPTRRALIMLAVLVLAVLSARKVSPWRAYFAAMLAVLLVNPLLCHSAGFCLSFGAVGVLLLGHQGRRPAPRHPMLYAQLLLFLGLAPLLMAWHFDWTILAFPANFIAIPLLGLVVMPLLFIGLLNIAVFPGVAELCFAGADAALTLLVWVLSKLAAVPIPWQPYAAPALVVGIAVFTVALLMPRGLPGRRVAAGALVLLLLWPRPQPETGALWVTVLDVGQGTAVLLQTRRHQLLYDVGPDFDSGYNSYDGIIEPYLRDSGRRKLDALVLSHGDRDHSGSFGALWAVQQPAQIFAGELLELTAELAAEGTPVLQRVASCHEGQRWHWDGVSFEFLPAVVGEDTASNLSGNNASCVLRVATVDSAVLLTGDIEKDREADLLARSGAGLRSALVLAPHHGSTTSSSAAFVESLGITDVVFSASLHNRYGHPVDEVVQTYARAGSRCWHTGLHGTLRFTIEGGKATLLGRGRQKHFFWEKEFSEMCTNATKLD
jgi:competence protein ComEC